MFTPPAMIISLLRSQRNRYPSSLKYPTSPTGKKPLSSCETFVFFLLPLYSNDAVGIFIQTTPGSPVGRRLPSSSVILSSALGHARPTVPGYFNHSSGGAIVPPPSVAA